MREKYEAALGEISDAIEEYCLVVNKEMYSKLEKAQDTIMQLIENHFDNPPLRFEELKEGMWVWDDVEKEFLKVKCVCVADEGHYIFKEGTKIIEFVLCGISSRTVDVEFEPNRFYRKQVEE